MRRKLRVAIIGAGPAGIAAAIQLTRSGIKPLVFEEHKIGGLLKNAHWIENYPGFSRGISGDTLVKHLHDHMKAWLIKVKKQCVRSLERSGNKYIIRAQRAYQADVVIVASGTKAIAPKIDIAPFTDQVLYEIDAIKKVSGRKIVIVGAGDAAFDYALHLGSENEILIMNRGLNARALPLLIRRTRSVHGITIMNNARIRAIGLKHNMLHAVISERKRKAVISCDYIVYAIGREPRLDFLSFRLQNKFPLGDKTLYFIGDVKNGSTRQVAIAVGDGVRAAMEITARYLAKR